MTFEEVLDHAIAMLQRRGRLTYSTLKRQFQLDDASLDDLKHELIEVNASQSMSGTTSWSGLASLPLRPRPPQLPWCQQRRLSGSPSPPLTPQPLWPANAAR
jgi:hypothetical protein